MSLKFAVLGILETFGPQSGYDIKRRFDFGPRHVWSADLSNIYRTLDKLEREDAVTVSPDESSTRGRKVYSITATGSQDLRDWLQSDFEIPPTREPVLLRLFFGKMIPPHRLREQIADYRNQMQELGAAFDIAEQMSEQARSFVPEDATYWQLTLNLGKRYVQTTCEWCDAVLKTLAKSDNQ